MERVPLGFELQEENKGDPALINVTQIDVSYPGYPPSGAQPEVAPGGPEPHMYPSVPGSNSAPIGFEGHVQDEMKEKDREDNSVEVNMDSPQIEPQEEEGGAKVEKEEETNLIDRYAQQIINEKATLFFKDGKRKIDFVLAYEPGDTEDPKKKQRRETFEKNLIEEGLELEYEGKESSKNGKTCFVKVHTPWETLARYAELLNIKMPLAENDMETQLESCFEVCWSKFPSPFDLDPDLLPEEPNYFTAPFNRARMDTFVIKDKDTFFTNAQRSKICYEILSRTHFTDSDDDEEDKIKKKFGIRKLTDNQTYTAAYPLHDGRYHSEHSLLTVGKDNDRHLLYELWARPGRWYKYQPLDQVRNYFGEKIGIYFTWLGFYTTMLIPAAFVGFIVFIYGLATLMRDIPSSEICDDPTIGNYTMCPMCDKRCTYWHLSDSCNYSKATYLFDNSATVAFAIFMALWASFFHEFWKRKQAEIEYEWDVADFEEGEETVRPEYEASVTRRRTNPVTNREEPFVPSWSKCFRYFTSFSVLLFFLALVLAAVFSVILYRIVMSAILYGNEENIIKTRASFISSITAACINLVIIIILNFFYQKVAYFLTELEQHRTLTEWEDAFTFKMFLFQFVNFYSSIFYIAFFKGKFVGRPGDYNRSLLDKRQEECDPSGCLIELCIQLGIVMVGKQIINNLKEIVIPKVMVWFRSRQSLKEKSEEKVYSRWEQDYNLANMPALGLFDEYLEMVIQYGFVTIFVAAFPLAPLFALINNIIEIRVDAYKFTTQWKRPLAERAQDIGIWFGILRGISAIAVVSNAAIIAFTSEFIPKLVYYYGYSQNHTLAGYTNFSLSVFKVQYFQPQSVPDDKKISLFGNVTECRYRGFFAEDPNMPGEYNYTMAYWHIVAAKLAFVVVFENLVVFCTWLVMYLIPDMPFKVKLQMLRENFLAKEALFNADTIQKQREQRTKEER
ncbi:anoctamin-4-like isoform X3 [Saccostrea echinata]|uniref:anoctamin-4-like isoform X3 n=1 Tax=Saccostrea echinata TaxID=191078 RepID=UPI002A8315A6|nr:anoctamin-4-like isoform X3 [Saccostrea echinata]